MLLFETSSFAMLFFRVDMRLPSIYNIYASSLLDMHRINCGDSSLDEEALKKYNYLTAGLHWQWFDCTSLSKVRNAGNSS